MLEKTENKQYKRPGLAHLKKERSSTITQTLPKGKDLCAAGAAVINNFQNSITTLVWNKALWLVVEGHMANQSTTIQSRPVAL